MDFKKFYDYVAKRLSEEGIFDKSEADFLICEVLSVKRSHLSGIKTITDAEYNHIERLLYQRLEHKPLNKILQKANFYGYNFFVNENVLSPRFETEILTAEVIRHIKQSEKKLNVLDMCTGSGCIASSIALETGTYVTAVDISKKALKVAQKNVSDLHADVTLIRSNLFNKLRGQKFDIIVSNPPYIRAGDIKSLEPEVKNYDPILALNGGKNGLKFYIKIINKATKYLNEGGKLFFEVGYDQAREVAQLMEKDFIVTIVKDYEETERIVYGIRR